MKIPNTLLPYADIPALSIRQPWVWMILNVGKDIENRTWQTHYRGKVLLHASTGGNREMWEDSVRKMIESGGWQNNDLFDTLKSMPNYEQVERGGIVGIADIVDCVTTSTSPWFMGPYGFVLENARPLPLVPCNGRLSFFDWTKTLKD